MHKLSFYVPQSHIEIVKNALFAIGAGKIGNYDHCCWQTKGEGQYRPLKNSQPFKGRENEICCEPEFLVEMICEDNLVDHAIKILLQTHPYETPAFSVWKVRTS